MLRSRRTIRPTRSRTFIYDFRLGGCFNKLTITENKKQMVLYFNGNIDDAKNLTDFLEIMYVIKSRVPDDLILLILQFDYRINIETEEIYVDYPFDHYGFDYHGFDREGYRSDGYNRYGINRYGCKRSIERRLYLALNYLPTLSQQAEQL